MFRVQRNKKTPNIVEFYHKEYKDGKEPEITLNEIDGKLILYKTFKRTLVEVNIMPVIIEKRRKQFMTQEQSILLESQIHSKCTHSSDFGRIYLSFNAYREFVSRELDLF